MGPLLIFPQARQGFILGDGFLINNDSLNFGDGLGERFDRGGAYWLAARKSFKKTFIGRFQTGTPVRGDLFYLGSGNPAQGFTELAGINLEYVDETYGTLGATYFRIVDVNKKLLGGFFALREDLDTFSIRGQGNAGVENLFLSFEYAHQTGNAAIEVDAYAWYVEAGYTFAGIPWTPSLNYRYSAFTGDDPKTAKSEGFDPLFFGFNRGYGTWFQGEVAANYTGPFNSNTKVHHVALKAQPLENLGLGALYFNFTTDETQPGEDDDFAQEIDLYAEWIVNDHLYVSPLYGIFIPGDGAEAAFGNDNTNHYFQIIAVITY
ncbi:MAG: alginate export family protein [Candidatus Competibacteraceae bacterium]